MIFLANEEIDKPKRMNEKSLQETYAPSMACFGCGPANEKGLHIRSFPRADEVVATFRPETYQEAFPGMLSGGIIGTFAGLSLQLDGGLPIDEEQRDGSSALHGDGRLYHQAFAANADGPASRVARAGRGIACGSRNRRGRVIAHDKVCATCRGTFVAVKPGHPAYHRCRVRTRSGSDGIRHST